MVFLVAETCWAHVCAVVGGVGRDVRFARLYKKTATPLRGVSFGKAVWGNWAEAGLCLYWGSVVSPWMAAAVESGGEQLFAESARCRVLAEPGE